MPTNKKDTPKVATVRKTAAMRRQEADAARDAAQAEFERNRPTVWAEIWVKAMRLALLRSEMDDFVQDNSWWFEDFSLDAKKQCFRTPNAYQVIDEKSLSLSVAQTALDELNRIYELMQDFESEQERKRQEAIETERKRQEALAKLNDEDKKVLGLSTRY